jgi:hypothetical protein
MRQSNQIDIRHSLNKESINQDEPLRLNPFSAAMISPQQNRYVFASGEPLETATERLLEMLNRFLVASIIGDHGTGKTTLIYSLIPQLTALGVTTSLLRLGKHSWQNSVACAYEQLSSVPLNFHGNSTLSRHCLIVDGFEQLPRFGKLALITAIHCHNRFPLGVFSSSTIPNLFMLVSAHQKQLMIPLFEKTEWNSDLAIRLLLEKITPLPEWLQKKLIQISSERFEQSDSRRSLASIRDLWLWLYDEYENLVSQRIETRLSPIKGNTHRN